MIGNTSLVQSATLVVAGIAAIASIVGVFFAARLSARSEQRVWQRDLRMQIYGALAVSVEEFSIRLTKSFRESTFEERLAAYDEVFRNLTEVRTYGALDVVQAADNMFIALAHVMFEVDNFETRSELDETLVKYRTALRNSLQIDND